MLKSPLTSVLKIFFLKIIVLLLKGNLDRFLNWIGKDIWFTFFLGFAVVVVVVVVVEGVV